MDNILSGLLNSKNNLRAEIFTSSGDIYNILGVNSQIFYYLNSDFKNLLNQKFNSNILEKIVSEDIIKIKNNDKIIWETNFKLKRNHIPILNLFSFVEQLHNVIPPIEISNSVGSSV